MRLLASRRWRLFLIIWIVYSVHFATNVVREHYPAFSISQHGTFRVDEYQDFHSDIFRHVDGHSYINNQVFVSMLAAVPLFIFEPVLDGLERYSKEKLARVGVQAANYRTDKPLRVAFFRLVKERGLDLRFGAATVVTSVFFMAPLTAGFLVYFYTMLCRRGAGTTDATEVTLLMAFCTPLFFRQSSLNHNMFVMFAMFLAFCQLWANRDEAHVPWLSRFLAGLFAGLTLATDYIGVIVLPLLWSYFISMRVGRTSWFAAVRESVPMVVGSLPAIGILVYSQQAMFGHPLLPAQYWMPNQNEFTTMGARGMTLPDPEILFDSLFGWDYGMYTWAPLLLVAAWPVAGVSDATLILQRRERLWVLGVCAALLLFASANQYSRLQFNSGFRYMIPLVPLLMLEVADRWRYLSAPVKVAVVAGTLVHSWVLTVFREPVLRSWALFLNEGIQLPWYRVLSMTANPDNPLLGTWRVPALLLTLTILTVRAIWLLGARLERQK